MTSPVEKKDHSFSDFLYWNMFAAVPVFTGVLAIFKHSAVWTAAFISVAILMAAAICRFFCTHCPHYVKGNTLKCMFFWGLPKLFDPRPGSYKFWEKAVAILSTGVILAFPVYWLLMEPGLLVVYGLSLSVFFISVRRNECARCIHRNCPVNPVPETS